MTVDQVVEMDQYLTRKRGREALSLKLGYIVKVLRGDVPYSDLGLPTNLFSFDQTGVREYVEGYLAANSILAKVTSVTPGRVTVMDIDVVL